MGDELANDGAQPSAGNDGAVTATRETTTIKLPDEAATVSMLSLPDLEENPLPEGLGRSPDSTLGGGIVGSSMEE